MFKDKVQTTKEVLSVSVMVGLILFIGICVIIGKVSRCRNDVVPLPDMDMLTDCLDEVFEGTELKTLETAMSHSSNYDITISTTLGHNDIWHLNIHQDPYVMLTLTYHYNSDDGWYISNVDWPTRRK